MYYLVTEYSHAISSPTFTFMSTVKFRKVSYYADEKEQNPIKVVKEARCSGSCR